MKYIFFTEHMHKFLGCIYDMACEAIKNGDKQEAEFCHRVIELVDIPEEVSKRHDANYQGGVQALLVNTYGRVELSLEWLNQASDQEIKRIQRQQEPITQWKYYK